MNRSLKTNALTGVWAASAFALSATFAEAAPKVVADITPVHSIVAAVMENVAEPTLIMEPGASPHGYAMRPSEASALAAADIVFWVGPTLTPWLARALETTGQNAANVELLEAEGIHLMALRQDPAFEAHDHDHGEEHHDDHHGDDHADEHGDDHAKHDDHDEHGHDDHDKHDDHSDHAEHDDHDKHDDHADHKDHGDHKAHDDHGDDHGDDHAKHDDHEGHDDHGHGDTDPHIWLDPANGRVLAGVIAAALAEIDPENAETYLANAASFKAGVEAAEAAAAAELASVKDQKFIVFHDAYHYFEDHFGLEAVGAISLSDAQAPGPQRVEEISTVLKTSGATCVFSEPQFDDKIVKRLTEGTGTRVGVIDPLGFGLEPGPQLYPQLIRNLASAMAGCLRG